MSRRLRRWVSYTLFMGVVWITCWLIFLPAGAASSASPWLSSTPPSIERVPGQAPLDKNNHNIDCVNETGIIRRAGSVPAHVPPMVSEQKIDGCATYAPYGKFNNNYLQLNNTGLYGTVSETVRPIPGSRTAIKFYGGTSIVSNAYLIPDFSSLLKPSSSSDGKLTYSLKPYNAIFLRDKRGSLLNIDHNSVSFSSNGDWMIANSYEGMLRINLKTYETLLFDEPFREGNPVVQSAISGDGRYAVLSSAPFFRFRLYDLQSCPTVNNTVLDRKNCTYRDVLTLLPAQTGSAIKYYEIRFLSDYTLSFYRREWFTNAEKTDRYIVTAAGQSKTKFEYLALGDSFASGEGAYQYRDGTDTDNNKCHTSTVSYPYLIKIALSLNSADAVTCSGAVLEDILGTRGEAYIGQAKDELPQSVRNKPVILRDFSPGYLAQINFLAAYQPDVVTVSIIGNDVGFGKKLLRCLSADTCFSSYEDRLEIFREMNSKFDTLVNLYQQLKQGGTPSRRVFAIGYPELAKTNGNCGLNVQLDADEITFSNELIAHLNNVIERAATKAGVRYVNVSKAFEGHRLCETTYSNTAVNGITAGNDKIDWWVINGPIGNETYHPNALGHRLLQQTILRATDNFTRPMPGADILSSAPPENSTTVFLSAPKTNRPLYRLQFNDRLTNSLLIRGAPEQLKHVTDTATLKPNTQVTTELNPGSIALGNFTTDSSGNIATVIKAPLNTGTGFYELRLQAEDVTGEKIAIYKTVYVAASAEDLDGDTLLNDHDPCVIKQGVTDDYDRDGIDDACDGEIQEPGVALAGSSPPLIGQGDSSINSHTVTHSGESSLNSTVESLTAPATLGKAITPSSGAGNGFQLTDTSVEEPLWVFQKLIRALLFVTILLLLLSYICWRLKQPRNRS